MKPKVIRLPGAIRPNTEEGIIVGAQMTAEEVNIDSRKNVLREMPFERVLRMILTP